MIFVYWIWCAAYTSRENFLNVIDRFPFKSCGSWLKQFVDGRTNQKKEMDRGNCIDGRLVCEKHRHFFCGQMARYAAAGRQSRRLLASFLLCCFAFIAWLTWWSHGNDSGQPAIRGEFSRLSFGISKTISMISLIFLLAYVTYSHALYYLAGNSLLRILRANLWRSDKEMEQKISDPNLSAEDRRILTRNYQEGPVNPMDRVDLPREILDLINPKDRRSDKLKVGPGFWETPVLELAVRRYQTLSNLLFLPFFALFMEVTVQNKIFDDFIIPNFEIFFYVVGFLILISASLLMQSRIKKCLSEANKRLVFAKSIHINHGPVLSFLESEGRRLEDANAMVSTSLISNPLTKAILIPLGGAGVLQSMELIAPFL